MGGRSLTLRGTGHSPQASCKQKKRGHCTQIGLAHSARVGWDSLPWITERAAVDELDRIFLALSRSEGDLSKVTALGRGRTRERVRGLVNMLLAGRKQTARARLRKAGRRLRPLVRQLNEGERELNRLAGELGVVV